MATTFDFDDMRSMYDVVVIGAGPAGCATATAFAARGAHVLLLESNPNAARRFAGEWIHPEGARILNILGLLEGLDAGMPARGFVVFPNDGLGAIALDYGNNATGFACEHATLVAHLRDRITTNPRIDFLLGGRANRLDGRTVHVTRGARAHDVRTPLTVVATGRSAGKLFPKSANDEKVSISLMAGLIVRDSQLPLEGYGHVIVGGPGPALAYRIAADQIRICIDVPHDARDGEAATDWIWRSFAEVLPSSLRDGVRRGLSEATLCWAANAFRPRRYRTSPGIALVGDAAGVFHPLTAMGITMSLLDGEALAGTSSLAEYAERRAEETYIPELLSNAIYQAFARSDAGTLAIRDSIFRTWRSSPVQRSRTMDLLGAATTRRVDFVRAFSHVALRAGAGALLSDRKTVMDLAGWLRWPLASVHPHASAMRTRSVEWAAPKSWAEMERRDVS
ncbi:MAG: FAD-dependent oxidoreductase [Polyangiales bacterium]